MYLQRCVPAVSIVSERCRRQCVQPRSIYSSSEVFPPRLLTKGKQVHDSRVPYGMPVIDPYYPVGDHESDIAVTVIRSDNDDVETWILSPNATIMDLREVCIKRWNVRMSFVFEHTMQFGPTRLYFFDPRFMRRAPLFGLEIQELPARVDSFTPEPIDDHLVPISVFNVDTSQRLTLLIPLSRLHSVWALGWLGVWKFTFNFTYQNVSFGHGARISDLVNPESPDGTPVLAFESHQLAPGDRNYRDPYVSTRRVSTRKLSFRKRHLEIPLAPFFISGAPG